MSPPHHGPDPPGCPDLHGRYRAWWDDQESNFVFDQIASRHSTTWLDPALLADPGLGFMVAACVPDLVQSVTFTDPPACGLRTRDGSWARIDADSKGVVQAGQRSVWNEVENAARRWEQLKRPDPARFGLTVSVEDGQRIWLDDPDGHQVLNQPGGSSPFT